MSTAALRTATVIPVPAPAQMTVSAPAPQAKATAAHPFAELLRQNRAAAATPAERETASAPPQEGDDAHPAAASPAPGESTGENESTGTSPAASQRDARQPKARGTGTPREIASTAKSKTAAPDPLADEAATPASDSKNPASTPPDPSLIAGALVNAGSSNAASAQAATSDADRAASAVSGKGSALVDASRADLRTARGASQSPLGDGMPTASSGAAGDRGAVSNDKNDAAATNDASDARDAAALDAPAGASFAGMLAETKTSHVATLVAHTNNDGATAAPQNTGLVAGATPGSNGVAAATLPVPVHAPEFAAAFGVQVSVLAKDGVQRAELHLNPTEMGPVSIQITLDGTQARVDFGADAAATRHAIEAGLPELASALRDAGFTLAGGGVAQHSGSNSGDNGGQGEAGRAAASRAGATRSSELDATATRLTRRVADGGVDLYA